MNVQAGLQIMQEGCSQNCQVITAVAHSCCKQQPVALLFSQPEGCILCAMQTSIIWFLVRCSNKQEDKQRQLLRTISDSPARPMQSDDEYIPVSTSQLEANLAGMV